MATYNHKFLASLVFVITLQFLGVGGLKNVSVISPGAVPLGHPIQMECHFDLEGDQLYAVKWYKGKKEFYRFIPNEVPQSKVFPLPGVNVDLSQSDKHRVTISDATFNLSGRYRCEVSADLSFDTALVTTSIDVVDFPDSDPIISLERSAYAVGEEVKANCTSLRTHPPVNLTWMVNGRQVRGRHVVKYSPIQEDDNVTTSLLGLKVETNSGSFRGGKLKLRCQATMFGVYNRSTEAVVEEERPRLASVLGTRESSSYTAGTRVADAPWFCSQLFALLCLLALLNR